MEKTHGSIEKKRRINNTNFSIIEDRLSSLPDVLLVDILKRLLLKNAAETSVLSHRWRYLWTQRDRLHFEFPTWWGSIGYKNFKKLSTRVDTIVRQLTSPTIRSFHLKSPHPLPGEETDMCSSYLDSWFSQICARNPEEIEVNLDKSDTLIILLPSFLFECRSLVKLKLSGNFSCGSSNDGAISLPNLEELVMDSYDMSLKFMETLIRSCPVLKTLHLALALRNDEDILIVLASNLEFLSILLLRSSPNSRIAIYTPKLEKISLHGRLVNYWIADSNTSALYSVDIGCGLWHCASTTDVWYSSKIAPFLKRISNVSHMQLHDNLGMFNDCYESYPGVLQIFRNLTRLTLQSISTSQLDWPSPIPACLLSRIECIELLELKGNRNGLRLLKYILRNAGVLETLHADIRCCDEREGKKFEKENMWREYKFCKSLFDLPRKSLTCEIKFDALSIHASSDDYNEGLLSC